jgi:hypothetical protein
MPHGVVADGIDRHPITLGQLGVLFFRAGIIKPWRQYSSAAAAERVHREFGAESVDYAHPPACGPQMCHVPAQGAARGPGVAGDHRVIWRGEALDRFHAPAFRAPKHSWMHAK